jgi:hypothetical protein
VNGDPIWVDVPIFNWVTEWVDVGTQAKVTGKINVNGDSLSIREWFSKEILRFGGPAVENLLQEDIDARVRIECERQLGGGKNWELSRISPGNYTWKRKKRRKDK